MEKKQIQFLATSPEELKTMLFEALKPYLNDILNKKPVENDGDILLTREETAELLSINLSTLWKFTKTGVLKAYSLPSTSRVYYKKSEVLTSIKPVL